MKRYLTPLLLSAALAVTGCATTAKGMSQSSMAKMTAEQTLNITAPKGTPLVVIRYPAFVEAEAEDAYYAAFKTSAIGGYAGKADSSEVNALADSLLLKSNYFALSLFKALAAKLPEHGVLLSPHTIKLGADGKLTSEPMTQAESLPNVVAVDFASYTFPDAKKMMGKEPLTFGDLITPLVTARTNPLASVPTQGVQIASAPLISRSAGNSRANTLSQIKALETGRLQPSVPELDFVAHLKGAQLLNVPSKTLSARMTPNTVANLPIEKIKLNSDIIKSYGTKTPSTNDPLRSPFAKGFANQIIGLLNQTDIEKATMTGRAAAIGQFDESLAALTLIGSDKPDYLARLRYAERLLEAEQKYLSVQSLRLFDGVENGEMGAQVRDILKAEYDILEQRRTLARQQNTATAFAVLGAVAAGAAIANGGSSGEEDCSRARDRFEQRDCIERQRRREQQACRNAKTQSEYNDCVRRYRREREERARNGNNTAAIAQIAIAGAVVAAQQAYAINQQSKTVGSNFWNSITPALEAQTDIQISLIGSNETITAIRYEDLQGKLQALYNKNQRSLDTVATRCKYSGSGTWLGVCENGQGNGPGVGVIRQADGTAVEYYGYAQNGEANGAGYKIVHTPTESYALEGTFSAGVANGTMSVTRGGQPSRLRTYSAGQDIGAAPAGQRNASPFGPQGQSLAALGG